MFCHEPSSVWPQGGNYTKSHLNQDCFRFRSDFLAVIARISYFKFLEFKEFSKTIIPFALVGYETGCSQLCRTGLVRYLPSHIQRALVNNCLRWEDRRIQEGWIASLLTLDNDRRWNVKQASNCFNFNETFRPSGFFRCATYLHIKHVKSY